MKYLVLSACVLTLSCAGAANNDLGQQLIKVVSHPGMPMPDCAIAYEAPKNSWIKFLAVVVCHQKKDCAKGAAQAAAQAMAADKTMTITGPMLTSKLSELIESFFQNPITGTAVKPLFIATFIFHNKMNWSFLYGDGPARHAMLRGELLFPQKAAPIKFESELDHGWDRRFQEHEDAPSFTIYTDHEVFKVLESQHTSNSSGCAIL